MTHGLQPWRALSLAPAALWSLVVLRAGAGAGEGAAFTELGPDNDWQRITHEEWRPGDLGNSSTSVPMKDLECQGESTALQHTPGITWVDVKALMHTRPRDLRSDRELFTVTMQIQRDESDQCVLGIASTSALLLPLTMPKFRNLARTLNNDQNFLFLNVSFYDSLRSGFPVFGIFDDLSSQEYRSWFETPESRQFFELPVEKPACSAPSAQALRSELQRRRQEWMQEGGEQRLSADLLLAAIDVYANSEAAASCRPAAAAAALVVAMSRLQAAADSGASSDVRAEYSVLRDVIELVTRAEELIRDHCWDDGAAFGMLVASPWNFWWLLQQMQFTLQRFLRNPWLLPGQGQHAEL